MTMIQKHVGNHHTRLGSVLIQGEDHQEHPTILTRRKFLEIDNCSYKSTHQEIIESCSARWTHVEGWKQTGPLKRKRRLVFTWTFWILCENWEHRFQCEYENSPQIHNGIQLSYSAASWLFSPLMAMTHMTPFWIFRCPQQTFPCCSREGCFLEFFLLETHRRIVSHSKTV